MFLKRKDLRKRLSLDNNTIGYLIKRLNVNKRRYGLRNYEYDLEDFKTKLKEKYPHIYEKIKNNDN